MTQNSVISIKENDFILLIAAINYAKEQLQYLDGLRLGNSVVNRTAIQRLDYALSKFTSVLFEQKVDGWGTVKIEDRKEELVLWVGGNIKWRERK